VLNPTKELWEESLEKDEKVICHPYDLEVILPKRCPRCKEASEMLIDGMTHLFGGTTVYEAKGTWVDDDGRIVRDENVVVESAHSCMSDEMQQAFYNLVMKCAYLADQDSVSMKQGKFFIKPVKGGVPRHMSLVPVTKRSSYGEAREETMRKRF
jgi:hypothetical protein